MPEIDGFDVCCRLKQNKNLLRIPVIFISGLTEPVDKVKAFGVGGVDFVTKPFQLEEVAARIDTQLKLYFYQSFFASLMVLYNPKAYAHALRVGEISGRVAEMLGLSDKKMIQMAGLFHDIGTIGAAEPLQRYEMETASPPAYQEYQQHPIQGEAIIGSIDDLRDVGQLIRYHHESFNGGGFPDGLADHEIPLGARIIAIADYIDHLVGFSPLPDAGRCSFEDLKKESGRKFDPSLYPWFVQTVQDYYPRLVIDVMSDAFELPPRKTSSGTQCDDMRSSPGNLLPKAGTGLSNANRPAVKQLYANDLPHSRFIAVF